MKIKINKFYISFKKIKYSFCICNPTTQILEIKSIVAAIFTDCRLFAYNLRVSWFQNIFNKMAFGDYPAEYNPKVHGPYDPARFYGKGTIEIYL